MDLQQFALVLHGWLDRHMGMLSLPGGAAVASGLHGYAAVLLWFCMAGRLMGVLSLPGAAVALGLHWYAGPQCCMAMQQLAWLARQAHGSAVAAKCNNRFESA